MRKRKMNGPRRQYTDELKVEAVRLGEAVGVLEASRRLGIPDTSIWNWIRLKHDGKAVVAGAGSAKRSAGDLEAENHRLRQELANAKADLEIVKKAAAYFAKESR
jgi:transposase